MRQWNLCPPMGYIYNATICLPSYARQKELYSLAVCSEIWGTLLQFSHSRIMDGVATVLAQSRLSLAQPVVLSHRSQTQWCSSLENAWIINGKGLENVNLAARNGLCQECIIHSSPQRFPIAPPWPLSPHTPAAVLAVMRALSHLLPLQWHLQEIHKVPLTCQIHPFCCATAPEDAESLLTALTRPSKATQLP